MDVCAENVGQEMVNRGDGKGLVKDWSCAGSILLQTDGTGDEKPELVNGNLANGIVLHYDPEPPTQTESCQTTLFVNRDCVHKIGNQKIEFN